MGRSLLIRFDRRAVGLLFAFALAFSLSVRAQTPPDPGSAPKTDPAPPPAQSPSSTNPDGKASSGAEVSSRDTAPTFKVRVNLVLVRVVVRDSQGNTITNLKKEDFQLQDNRKPQTISTFSVETPESHAIVPTVPALDAPAPGEAAPPLVAALPQRFVGLVFDDTDMLMQDVVSVRAASSRLFDSLAPSDRVGMYTTSGQLTQEFTSDHAKLKESLLGIVPHPLATAKGSHDCPDINYYEADQIVNFHSTQALAVATEEAIQCAFRGDRTQQAAAQSLAQGEAD